MKYIDDAMHIMERVNSGVITESEGNVLLNKLQNDYIAEATDEDPLKNLTNDGYNPGGFETDPKKIEKEDKKEEKKSKDKERF